MHRIFHPLDRRRASLLLTLMTHGGADALPALDFLTDDEQGAIKEKAQALLQIPGDKRALFIAHEFKGLMAETSARGLEAVDPSWIVDALSMESPPVVAAILIGLPNHQLKAVIERLPGELRRRLPPKDAVRQVPAEVVRGIRQTFENRFAPMPTLIGKNFSFRDIVTLEHKELLLLFHSLGLEELAAAFVSVGRYALAELCKRLPREYATELIGAVKEANAQDAMELKSAQRFLGRVLVNYSDAEELSRKAGLYRLSKALVVEDRDYVRAFYQRQPKAIASQLESYLQKVQELAESDDMRARHIQNSVLRRVSALAQKGIMPRLSDFQFQYHEAGA
jgi:flagellar motor switch protein FliG